MAKYDQKFVDGIRSGEIQNPLPMIANFGAMPSGQMLNWVSRYIWFSAICNAEMERAQELIKLSPLVNPNEAIQYIPDRYSENIQKQIEYHLGRVTKATRVRIKYWNKILGHYVNAAEAHKQNMEVFNAIEE